MGAKHHARLHHIGIATSSSETLERLFGILGASVSHQEEVPEQGVHTRFLPLPGRAPDLEFLVPIDPKGTVAQFLSKRGPGIHHLSFEVEKGRLDPVSKELRNAGFNLLYDMPRLGAHAMRVQFIHPASCGGILIEIMEPLQ